MADPDALRFLRIARADLREAKRMLELSGFRVSSIGFLLQQACEKAFNGWIYSRGGVAPFTHDLVGLMDWLKDAGVSISAYGSLADLTFFAVQSRYDDTIAITRPDWPILIRLASALLNEVEDHLQ